MLSIACLATAGCALRSTYAESAGATPAAPLSASSSAPATRNGPVTRLSPGTHHLRTADGRGFLLTVPTHPHDPAPLVVALGGLGWSAEKTREQMRLDHIAEQEGALVAYPWAPRGLWNAGDCCRGPRQNDVRYLRQLRQTVHAKARIDAGRTLLLGFSSGGMLAYHAACNDHGWPGIAVLGATLTADCHTDHPFAIINVNGTRDTVVPWNGGWSHYTQYQMPRVWGIDRDFAHLFGCGTVHTSKHGRDVHRSYAGCSDGRSILEIRRGGLKHHWPLRQVDGYDMGPQLWRLALG